MRIPLYLQRTLFPLIALALCFGVHCSDTMVPEARAGDYRPNAESFFTSRFAYAENGVDPKILIVDNLDPVSSGNETTGRGTFEWCVTREYPRVVLFEVSGIIDYSKTDRYIRVGRDAGYLWIVGQSAPAPGITLKGASFYPDHSNDILITHMKFRGGDSTEGVDPVGLDGFSVYDGHRIALEYCTISWGIDSPFDSAGNCDDLTVNRCLIYEGLNHSVHYQEHIVFNPEPHAMSASFGYSTRVAFTNNLTAYGTDRSLWMTGGWEVMEVLEPGQPPVKVRKPADLVIINNLLYNASLTPGVKFGGAGDAAINASYVGNVVLPAPVVTDWRARYSGDIKSQIPHSSKIYLEDNLCLRRIEDGLTDEWGNMRNNGGLPATLVSPFDLTPYTILDSALVKESVLAQSGSKFKDVSDRRVINDIRTSRPRGAIDSPYPLPARVLDWRDTAGEANMSGGHDWSGANSESFVVNGHTVVLDADCTSADASTGVQNVIDHLNAKLPQGVEAFRIWAGKAPGNGVYVGLRSKKVGDSAVITIQNDFPTLRYAAGTYTGSNGIGGYPLQIEKSHTLAIPGNPHAYEIGNGYTNLENWILAMDDLVIDTQPPSIPDNLAAHAVSSSQIDLTWSASTDNTGVLGYRVFRNYVEVGLVGTTSYSDTGLDPGTEYIYQVSAYDEAGVESFRQDVARATTNAAGEMLAGDVNNDRIVNLEDEILVLRVLSDDDPASLSMDAEVNGDARLGLAEAIYILRKISE